MATATTPDYPQGLTFEKVWAMFQETGRQIKENAEKAAEERKKADEKAAKERKETYRQMKELSLQIGGLNNSFGELAEHLVAPGITQRFNDLGFHFDAVAPGGIVLKDKSGKIISQADLVLENGDYIVIVEVKSKPRINITDDNKDDIKKHIKRMEKFRQYYKRIGDRKLLGAIAGAIFGIKEKEAAIEAGFYAIEQSGDTMKLVIPDGFVPKEW